MKVFLIRYAELTIKGKNRKEFERILLNHIQKQFSSFDVVFKKDRSRIYAYLNDVSKREEFIDYLSRVPGISSFSEAEQCEKDIESIGNCAAKYFDTSLPVFKVETKRSDKNYEFTSQEISSKVGGYILRAHGKNAIVNLHNYQQLVYVEVQNEDAYVFFKVYQGLGGLPLGSSGKAVVMLSGGIDSPVAAIEAMKRGLKITCLHFSSPPYTSEESLNKVKELTKVLFKYDKDIKLFDVEFGNLQHEINVKADERYGITILRRMMFRKASELAYRIKAKAIVTGEVVGQVASQTLESMTATHDACSHLVIQPLITRDKLEIISMAKRFGTYEISILPFEDCCVVFLPKNPIIKPKLKDVIEQENLVNFEKYLIESKINIYNYDIINSVEKRIDKFL